MWYGGGIEQREQFRDRVVSAEAEQVGCAADAEGCVGGKRHAMPQLNAEVWKRGQEFRIAQTHWGPRVPLQEVR